MASYDWLLRIIVWRKWSKNFYEQLGDWKWGVSCERSARYISFAFSGTYSCDLNLLFNLTIQDSSLSFSWPWSNLLWGRLVWYSSYPPKLCLRLDVLVPAFSCVHPSRINSQNFLTLMRSSEAQKSSCLEEQNGTGRFQGQQLWLLSRNWKIS